MTLEGLQVDRYALNVKNLRFSSGIQEFISGSVYRAQEGGYLARMDFSYTSLPDTGNPLQEDFDPNQPVTFDYLFTQVYYPAGSLEPLPPAGCPQPGAMDQPLIVEQPNATPEPGRSPGGAG